MNKYLVLFRYECIRTRHENLIRTRKNLRERLEGRTQQGLWKCITDQGGLFAYIGLSGIRVFPTAFRTLPQLTVVLKSFYIIAADASNILKQKYHIYMLDGGRINVPSLNEKNLDYFVDSLIKTLQEINTNACPGI